MKYIGRKYIPFDNSYSINVTEPLKFIKGYEHAGKVLHSSYLAGTNCSNPIICETLTNPFKCNILHSGMNNRRFNMDMIMVKNIETQEVSMVMYHADGFKVKERIKAVNEHNKRNHNNLPQINYETTNQHNQPV